MDGLTWRESNLEMNAKQGFWMLGGLGIVLLYIGSIGPAVTQLKPGGLFYGESYYVLYYPVLLSCEKSERVHTAVQKYCDLWRENGGAIFDVVFIDWALRREQERGHDIHNRP